MASDRIGVAVIGAGNIAEVAHLPALHANPDVELRWLVDTNERVASERAARWGVQAWAADYRRALADPAVDAVDICAPAGLHAQLAVEALAADKHVLLEKPLALSVEDALRVRAAARDSARTFMVAENWYFSTAVRRAEQLLRAGAVGEPCLLKTSHESGFWIPPADPDAGIGHVTSAGTHTLSAARRLLGELSSVYAVSSQQTAASGPIRELDTAVAAEFRPGLVGSFTFTGHSRHLGERRLLFTIFGDAGRLDFDVWSGEVALATATGEVVERSRHPSMGYAEEIAHFVACIRTGDAPIPGADDQVRTVATIDAIYRSLQSRAREAVPSIA